VIRLVLVGSRTSSAASTRMHPLAVGLAIARELNPCGGIRTQGAGDAVEFVGTEVTDLRCCRAESIESRIAVLGRTKDRKIDDKYLEREIRSHIPSNYLMPLSNALVNIEKTGTPPANNTPGPGSEDSTGQRRRSRGLRAQIRCEILSASTRSADQSSSPPILRAMPNLAAVDNNSPAVSPTPVYLTNATMETISRGPTRTLPPCRR